MRVVNTLKQDGTLSVEGSRTLSLSYSLAEFGAGSRTLLGPNATVLCQSGETRFGGRLAAAEGVTEGGEVLVRALATQSGQMDVNALTLHGGVLATETGTTSTARRLRWLSGSITGPGAVNVGHPGASDGQLELADPAGNKVLAGPKLHLYGSGRVGASNTLLLQASSSIHVASGSTLVHEALSQLLSGDDTAVSMSLDADSMLRFETGAGSSGSIVDVRTAAGRVTRVSAAPSVCAMLLAAVVSKLGMLAPKPKELPGEKERSVKAASDRDEALMAWRGNAAVAGGGGMDTGAA